jgi:hypothetical protein
MTLAVTLEKLVSLLGESHTPYMLSGSVLSSYYGVQRTTQDLDIVIDPDEDQLRSLIILLEKNEFYVGSQTAMRAFRNRTQFNVIDIQTVWKVDLVLRKEREFSRVEFSRRQKRTIFGVSLWVASIEDSILSKLEWSKNTGSDRQRNDVAGMFKLQGNNLDLSYLEKWAINLNVAELLHEILEGS